MAPAVAGPAPSRPLTGSLTAPGALMGTLPYMAPEQIEGRPADARTDIFAFGAVLYEMLTGRAPFAGRTSAQMIAATLEREPAPLMTISTALPPALDRVVRRCLEKNPDERWQTMTDLLCELRWLRESGATAALPSPIRRHRWLTWAGGVTLLATTAILLLTRGGATRDEVTQRPMRFVLQPPPGQRFAGVLAFSRDGMKVAFAAGPADQDVAGVRTTVWVYSFDTGLTWQVPNSRAGVWPFFTPDGRYVGFCQDEEVVKLVDLASGTSATVVSGGCTDAGPEDRSDTIAYGKGGTIYEVRGGGGPARLLLAASPEIKFRRTLFLPDDRHFLVQGDSAAGEPLGLYLADRETHSAKMLLPNVYRARFGSPGWLVYALNSTPLTLMAQRFDVDRLTLSGPPVAIARRVFSFGVSDHGLLAYFESDEAHDLVWVSRDGKSLGRVTTPPDSSALHPRISPDGRKVAYELWDAPDDQAKGIWVHDDVRNTAIEVTSGSESYPLWSGDSKTLLFQSADGRLLRQDITAGTAHEILRGSFVSPFDWAPDGTEIIYGQADHVLHVWRASASNNRATVLNSGSGSFDAAVSPDRKWIAYVRRRSNWQDLYLASYPDLTRRWSISPDGGAAPAWRADGRELFYVAPDKRIMAVAMRPSAEQPFTTPIALFQSDLADSADESYHVTPDGQRFIIVVMKHRPPSPVQMLTNWTALVPK
jgi:Tol biopolymer transport system component